VKKYGRDRQTDRQIDRQATDDNKMNSRKDAICMPGTYSKDTDKHIIFET